MTSAKPWAEGGRLRTIVGDFWHRIQGRLDNVVEDSDTSMLKQLESAACEAVSPLERLERGLHPWVAFGIMPVFAFANAGVTLGPAALVNSISLAVAVGLIVGKPLGILTYSWLAVSIGFARLPAGVNWRVMLGAGCLSGIGFTMSLFIAGLTFDEALLDRAKFGVLAASTMSAIIGCTLLLLFLRTRGDAAH